MFTTARPGSGRFLTFLALALVAALLVGGCARAGTPNASAGASAAGSASWLAALTTEQRDWLRAHGTIRVAAFADYQPFGFVGADGVPAGMTIDVWRLVAERLGATVAFTPVTFTEMVDGVKGGRFDSAAGFLVLDSRKDDFAFSTPYYEVTTYLYVGAGYTDRTTLQDLAGLTVAVVDKDSSQVTAEAAGLATLVVSDYEATVLAVADGRAQALIMDEPVASYYLAKDGLEAAVRRVGGPMTTGSVAFPVRREQAILAEIIDAALVTITPAELDAIVAKWTRK